MLIKPVAFSFVVSVLSLILVLVWPLELLISESDKEHSPYLGEIEQLLEKGEDGLTTAEYEALIELSAKNNLWFEERDNAKVANVSGEALNAWKARSSRIAPIIMVIWALLFYFFFVRYPGNQSWLVLVYPVLLTGLQLMSILQLLLIVFAILGIRFWFLVHPMTSSSKNQP
jgi:hypothetical protein